MNCDSVVELIIPYINQELNSEYKFLFLDHILKCDKCRKELALMIKFQNSIKTTIELIPEDIRVEAFVKVKRQIEAIPVESLAQELNSLFTDSIPKPTVPFTVVNYVMSSIFKTVKLSIKNY